MTGTDLIDELGSACQIRQSAKRFVSQRGSLQIVDARYATLDRGVAESDVPSERIAAQIGRRTRRDKVVPRLGLEMSRGGSAAPFFHGRCAPFSRQGQRWSSSREPTRQPRAVADRQIPERMRDMDPVSVSPGGASGP